MANRLIELWHKVTSLTLRPEMSQRRVKQELVINKGWIAFLLAVTFLNIPGILIAYFVLIYVDPVFYREYYLTLIPTVLTSVAGIGLLLLRIRNPNSRVLLQSWYHLLQFYFISTCFLFGDGSNPELFLYALMLVPFMILNRDNIPLVLWSLGTNLLLIFLINWWYLNYDPLFPLLYRPIEIVLYFYYAFTFAMMMVAAMYYFWRESLVAEDAIEEERDKSDKLLLNILPETIAAELRNQGKSDPREFESVTVLFTDFVGFTSISENLTPTELIEELDRCFSYFDSVTQKYNLEKIKTIGDSYMLAGGLPEANNTHAIDCALAALEIQDFMNQMRHIKEEQNLPYWELRLGMHTGPLVAGVIADMKFQYDVFGDTVNTASRMESSGESGRINISASTHDILRFLFACEYRGKVKAKNKGLIDMHFLNGIQPRFSRDGKGRVPNERFLEIHEKLKRGGRLVAREKSCPNSKTTQTVVH